MATAKPVLVVQHHEVEGPYAIGDALRGAGLSVCLVRTDRGELPPPDARDLAGLVVMGGPMSAYDDAGFPTRRQELDLLGDALRRGTPILGVCLGAQLLAAAGGADVGPGHGAEIGWGPIELTPAAATDPLFGSLPGRFEVLHWHSDTCGLPAGAVHLARSGAYQVQAFRLGRWAWGLQFHLEVVAAGVDAFVTAMPGLAAVAPAGAAGVRRHAGRALAALHPHRCAVLERFAALVGDKPSSATVA